MANQIILSLNCGSLLKITTDGYGAMIEVFKAPFFDNDGHEITPPNYVMFQVQHGKQSADLITALAKPQG